jgi:hypothetical protein
VLAAAGVAGCAQTGAGTAPGVSPASAAASGARSVPGWSEPARYGFVLDSTCGERALIGRFRVAVVGGRVVRTEGLDDAAKRAVKLRLANLVPTLGQLVAEAQTAREDGAAVARTDVDPVDGHPTAITIDHSTDAVDDESCYLISEYTTEVTPTAGSTSK